MGIFFEQVKVFNRAPIALTVTFDGQSKDIPPGESFLPEVVIPYAKNQNPIMGTQDPHNPHMSGCQYLIGVVGTHDNCEPMTKEEWEAHLRRPCREDEQIWFEERYGNDPKAKLIVRGAGRKTAATSRHDSNAGSGGGTATFERRD